MAKFRKKPVVVEAVRWLNRQIVDGPEWFFEAEREGVIALAGTSLHVQTLEGNVVASPGDWVIRGVKGELYPCRDDVFRLTYEPVDEPAARP